MDPITISMAMAIAALAPLAGDLIGQVLGAKDKETAMQLVEQARQRFNIPVNTIQQLAAHMDSSQLSGVRADPAAVAAQHEALAGLQRISTEGADNPEFRAAMDAGQQQAGQFANQRNAALAQEAQSHGMGGSGQEYAGRLQANADAANRVGRAGFEAAAEARKGALSAMQAYGDLGGHIRSQDFDEKALAARAADELGKWNESNRAGAYATRFGQQMGKATAQANADTNAANVYGGNAAQTQNQWQGYGAGVGQAGGALGQSEIERQRKKMP